MLKETEGEGGARLERAKKPSLGFSTTLRRSNNCFSRNVRQRKGPRELAAPKWQSELFAFEQGTGCKGPEEGGTRDLGTFFMSLWNQSPRPSSRGEDPSNLWRRRTDAVARKGRRARDWKSGRLDGGGKSRRGGLKKLGGGERTPSTVRARGERFQTAEGKQISKWGTSPFVGKSKIRRKVNFKKGEDQVIISDQHWLTAAQEDNKIKISEGKRRPRRPRKWDMGVFTTGGIRFPRTKEVKKGRGEGK